MVAVSSLPLRLPPAALRRIARGCIIGLTAALATAGSALSGPAEVSLVLDRRAGAVELYLAGPAPRVLAVFGGPEDLAPGRIDPRRWRIDGSFDFGDALIAGTEARVGGAQVRFEVMSAMLHPENDPLPLVTPLDGMIAIAVCTAPEDGAAPEPEDSRLYLCYIAYAGDTGGEIDFAFATPLGAGVSIGVRDHADGVFLAGYRLDLQPGSARLVLRAAPEGLPLPALLALAALLVNAAFAGGAILWSRRPSHGAVSRT